MYLIDTNQENTLVDYCSRIILCVLLALPTTGYSQQWQFEPVVKLTANFNDNVNLITDDLVGIDSAAFSVDANGRFVRRSQTGELRIAPRIRSKTYSEDALENSNDVFFDFFAGRTLERSNYGLQARFAQEDILTAELDDPDFDNPDVNNPVVLDSGRIRAGSERESIIISPYFSHDWTETFGFGVNANYVDVTYDQNVLNLFDYTDASIGAEFTVRTSGRSTWSIGAFGSDYEAKNETSLSESQTIGASVEFRHEFSATLQGRISIGYEDIDTDVTSGANTASDSNGVTVFSAGITKKGDISRVVLDASQTVDPSGTGFLQERTQFRLRYTRQLSPKMYGNFNARIQTTEEVSPDLITPTDRDYQRYGLGLEWRLSRLWALRGDYTFTDQEFDLAVGNASSNEIALSFVYDPARRAR